MWLLFGWQGGDIAHTGRASVISLLAFSANMGPCFYQDPLYYEIWIFNYLWTPFGPRNSVECFILSHFILSVQTVRDIFQNNNKNNCSLNRLNCLTKLPMWWYNGMVSSLPYSILWTGTDVEMVQNQCFLSSSEDTAMQRQSRPPC